MKELDQLKAAINATHAGLLTALRRTTDEAVKVGKLLLAAKKLVGHGKFEPWVEDNCPFCTATARNYMGLVKRSKTAKKDHELGLSLTAAYARFGIAGKGTTQTADRSLKDILEPIQDPGSPETSEPSPESAFWTPAKFAKLGSVLPSSFVPRQSKRNPSATPCIVRKRCGKPSRRSKLRDSPSSSFRKGVRNDEPCFSFPRILFMVLRVRFRDLRSDPSRAEGQACR